jgi:hypothetical protein
MDYPRTRLVSSSHDYDFEMSTPKKSPKKYRKHSMEPEIFLQLQLSGPKGKLIDPSKLKVADPSKISEAKLKERSRKYAPHVSVERRPSPTIQKDLQEKYYLQLFITPPPIYANESTVATIDTISSPAPITPPQKSRTKKSPKSVVSTTLAEFDGGGGRSLGSFLSSVRIGKRKSSSVSGLSAWRRPPSGPSVLDKTAGYEHKSMSSPKRSVKGGLSDRINPTPENKSISSSRGRKAQFQEKSRRSRRNSISSSAA